MQYQKLDEYCHNVMLTANAIAEVLKENKCPDCDQVRFWTGNIYNIPYPPYDKYTKTTLS